MAPSTSSKPTKSGSHPSALAAITIDLTSPGPSSGLSPQSYDTCDSHGATTTRKKRKVDRACDACRRRKTKCDGPKVQDNICTNCLQANKHCTYLEASKPRGPPKAYVTGLEDRMENLETLLKQLRPDADFASELGPPIIRGSWREQDPSHSYDEQQLFLSSPSSEIAPESKVLPTMSGFSTTGRTTRLMSNPHPTPGRLHQKREEQYHDNTDESDSSEDPSNFDVIEIESISGLVQKLTLQGEAVSTERPSDAHARFHGKSSSVGLIEAAQRFKMMHLLDAIEGGQDTRRESPDSIGDAGFSDRRPEYWTMPRREHQWEELHIDSPELVSSVLAQFPPEDLALELINLYFLHAHCRFPLLHRPTFERHWKENLHHKNTWFTALCLGLFAVASRWSNDVRVVPEGKTTDSGEPDWGLAGPKYFELGSVLHEVRRRLFYPATLFEVQAFAIFALYLRGTPQYPIAWTVVGIATRKLQDVGAHRKKVYHSEPTVDGELWKRAFWCLVVLDRIECASLGRRCSFGQEDFDVDLPLEVDDEYWEMENTALNFTQPKGVPAKIGVFNQIIKLSQVMAFALKTLYAIDKSKIFFGLTPAGWRSEVVQQMDSALKEWTTSLPEHLVWSKQREGSTFAADAATLQTFYHLVQILIYEPLIPSPFSPSSLSESSSPPLPFPALDKCVEAAQACARISETQALQAHLTWPIHIYAAQASSAILLFKIWDTKSQEKAKRAQGVEDTKPPVVQVIEPLMADVRIFVHMLEWAKPRWGLVSPFL
ncbi:fungal-specific transcription factor domain-containing protein [Lyophyllum atratum]|nr:fungal-specific transcription factor domain-containing protein [Lyophyllum atratum]